MPIFLKKGIKMASHHSVNIISTEDVQYTQLTFIETLTQADRFYVNCFIYFKNNKRGMRENVLKTMKISHIILPFHTSEGDLTVILTTLHL